VTLPGGIGSKTLVGGNMKRLLILSLAISVAMPALAQTQMPVYRDRSGSFQGASGVVVLNPDGTPTTGTGATSEQTQGTAPNGSAPAGNPNLVAGWDGALQRTIRTTGFGNVVVAFGNGSTASTTGATQPVFGTGADGTPRPLGVAPYVFNGASTDFTRSAPAADATAGGGLLGAGILGQYQTTLPTYTAGQFGTLAMNAKGILNISGPGVINDGLAVSVATGIQDNVGIIRPLAEAPMMYTGTGFAYNRGDTTGGLYTQERERSQYFTDFANSLAAGASIGFLTRDGGASPSQWGTFSCWARSDQASSTGGFALQGSNDGTNWAQFQTASVAANSPTRLTERNDMRYHRCLFVNGATASTTTTVTSSFGN
jgi:hypothetical protein